MTDDVIVRTRHKTAARLCNRSSRPWMDAQVVDGVPLSWRTFITVGYPASVLRKTGNPYAIRVCEIAEAEARRG